MYQMVIKYPKMSLKYSKWPYNVSKLSNLRPSKIYPNFWVENKSSGNPAVESKLGEEMTSCLEPVLVYDSVFAIS
jgi:hypothetical protein